MKTGCADPFKKYDSPNDSGARSGTNPNIRVPSWGVPAPGLTRQVDTRPSVQAEVSVISSSRTKIHFVLN